MNTFSVLDVETANSNRTSVCQIGVVHVNNSHITDQWMTYINPHQEFNVFNSHLHGITAGRVAKSPSLHDIKDELRQQLHDRVVVSHGSFDRGALGHILSDVQWIDSQKIVRRAYPERYRTSRYNLKKPCS